MFLYLIPLLIFLACYLVNLSLVNSKKLIGDMFITLPTLPVIGNAHMFIGDAHNMYKVGNELFHRFGKSFCVFIGPICFVMLYSPEEAEAVLNNTTHIRKSRSYDGLLPWIGEGLLTSTGERWRKSRKLLTPAFHFKILDGFMEKFNKNTAALCEELKKQGEGKSFDIVETVKMAALDNICEAAMGVSVEAQKNPTSDYVGAIHTLCHNVYLRTMRPWLRPDILFNLTTHGYRQRKALKIVHSFSRNVIEARIAQRRLKTKEPEEAVDEHGEGGPVPTKKLRVHN